MKKISARSKYAGAFICPKCGRQLAWALPAAEMQCPKCGTWVNNKNRKGRGQDDFFTSRK